MQRYLARCQEAVRGDWKAARYHKHGQCLYTKTKRVRKLTNSSQSGTSAIADDTNGLSASETIYDDANAEQMASLPITNLHRVVDTTLVAADAEGGYTYTYILMPATIWGHADHALTRAGIANYRSIQMPNVIAGSLLRGRPGVWGKGAGIWTSVEIGELGDLYMLLVDAVLGDPASVPHGREGYYFGATEEHSWYEASRAIGEAMVALGKTDNPEPTSFTDEEIAKWYKVSVPSVVLRG